MNKKRLAELEDQCSTRLSELSIGAVAAVPELVAEIRRLHAVLEEVASVGCDSCLIDYAWGPGECPACLARAALLG